jgi:hypothetical protein
MHDVDMQVISNHVVSKGVPGGHLMAAVKGSADKHITVTSRLGATLSIKQSSSGDIFVTPEGTLIMAKVRRNWNGAVCAQHRHTQTQFDFFCLGCLSSFVECFSVTAACCAMVPQEHTPVTDSGVRRGPRIVVFPSLVANQTGPLMFYLIVRAQNVTSSNEMTLLPPLRAVLIVTDLGFLVETSALLPSRLLWI